MSNAPIQVQGLSKRFCRSLRRSMVYGASDILREAAGRPVPETLRESEFYALRDLSFTVEPGQCLGVIGPNGSGKSTLLKLLTGIYPPDRGSIRIRGRVAALIEVGVGFHPLLTGRENIYVGGGILGLRREEIRRQMDEIIAFSELESFIDTPVKSYSSGMYVRLGFSLMAHLKPEILFVDEALSVGDTAFRIKSMNKIREMVSGGATCLIVTHDLYQVSALCQRTLVLNAGAVVCDGPSEQGIGRYLDLIHSHWVAGSRQDLGLEFQTLELSGADDGPEAPTFTTGEALEIRVKYRLHKAQADGIQIGMLVKSAEGHRVFGFTTLGLGKRISGVPGLGCLTVRLPRNPLLQGWYSLTLSAFDSEYQTQLASWADAIRFRMSTSNFNSLQLVGLIMPEAEIIVGQ